MAQPDLIPMPFAENATPGTIEPIEATTPTVPQDATWSTGFPQVTMQPLAAGGIPPRGQNFNGVLNALSRHIFHTQGGGQYKWSDDHGPYSIGDVLQSDDGLRAYVSIVNNNTDNFNTNPSAIGTSWLPWGGDAKANSNLSVQAGAGLTGGGTLTQNRTLAVNFATTAQAQALTDDTRAITPKKLADAMNAHVLGMGQTWQDVTASRSVDTIYTNTTGRSILVTYRFVSGHSNWSAILMVDEIETFSVAASEGTNPVLRQSLVGLVPAGSTYRVHSGGTHTNQRWMELR